MPLTQIRNAQIKPLTITDAVIATNAAIAYTKLNLSTSLVAGDLAASNGSSVHTAVLDSHLLALWDIVLNKTVSGTSTTVTTEVDTAAITDTLTLDYSAKGILSTGSTALIAGFDNYKIQIRDNDSKDPVEDGIGGSVYGTLHETVGNVWTLSYFDSDDSAFTMGANEEQDVTVVADVSDSLDGKYFIFDTPATSYFVWFNTSGGAAVSPAPAGRTEVQVALTTDAIASAVATATALALDALGDVGASALASVVTITNDAAGNVAIAQDGSGTAEAGFTYSTTTHGSAGVVDFMFAEVYSYYSAPALAFITGVGFADIVGVAGTHNHNDLYYSKVELESGQLDDRYYTETELDNGVLDARYWTEAELPVAGATGANVLDGRYYTESEIGSTTNGSSGADQVGVTATGQLGSSTVQDALEELQGDIDAILTDVDHSLDDAYNDGATIAVDTTDVLWDLTDNRDFNIRSDSGATEVFTVGAGAGGDTVGVTGSFNVTGASTLDATTIAGALGQSGGTVTLNATGAMDLDSSAGITVDGAGIALNSTAASNFSVAGAALTLSTTTSGDIDIAAAGNVTFNDSIQTTERNFSQTNADGFASEFTYTTPADFNWSRTNGITTTAVSSVMGALNSNREDIDEYVGLIRAQGAAGGATLIGTEGITGILPTGGSVGSDADLQDMLEGIAAAAGSLKAYDNQGAFTTDKGLGTYLPVDTLVLIKDTNRFVRVMVAGTATVEDTDWEYLWSATNPMAGATFNIQSTGAIVLDSDSTVTLNSDTGFTIADDSGASIAATSAGQVDIDSATGQKVDIVSDTEIILNGGASVDIDGTAVTIDGALTATGALNDTMVVTTSGTGQVQLSAAQEIDLTGGDIDINAGSGKTVYIDSDTEVQISSTTLVDINGGTDVTIDATNIATTGILTQTGATQIIGAMNFDGAIDHDGASFDSTVSGTFTVVATTDVDITGDTVDLTASGATISMTTAGLIDIDSATGQKVDIVSDTEIILNGGSSVDIDGTAVAIDGALTATGATNDTMIVTTSGTGQVQFSSSVEIDLNAPLIDVHGNIDVASNMQINVDKINITSVDPTDTATISGQRTGTVSTANVLTNGGFEIGTGVDADDWTEGASVNRVQSNKYYGEWSVLTSVTDLAAPEAILTQATTGLTANTVHTVSFWAKGTNGGGIEVVLNGDTSAMMMSASTNPTSWTRYNIQTAGASNTAAGDLVITAAGTGSEDYDLYIDAVMVEEAGAVTDYFSTETSEMLITIGDNANDAIKFRSYDGVDTYTNLLVLNQTTARVYGDLIVDGETTTISSNNIHIGDNMQTWNADITAEAQNSDAYLQVKRVIDSVSVGSIQSLTLTGTTDGGSDQHEIELGSGEGANWTAGQYVEIYSATDTDNNAIYKVLAVGGADTPATHTGSANLSTGDATWFATPATFTINVSGAGVITVTLDTNTTDVATTVTEINTQLGTALVTGVTAWASGNNIELKHDSTGLTADFILAVGGGGADALVDLGWTAGTYAGADVGDLDILILNKIYNTLTILQAGVAGSVRENDPAIIRWNETTDTWQVWDHGDDVYYNLIVSSVGSTGLTMDSAYDGGSAVTVDNTNVAWTLSAAKNFSIVDPTDTSKFVVTNGTGADSVKIDTTGGVDIDADAGITINENSGAYLTLSGAGEVNLAAATGEILYITGDADVIIAGGTEIDLTATLIDINGNLDVDGTTADILVSGAFSIDGGASSNVTVTAGTLTLSTATSGDVDVTSAGVVDIDGATGVTIDAGATYSIVATSDTLVQLAGGVEVDLTATTIDINGILDHDGATANFNLTDTGATSFTLDTLGGVDFNVAGVVTIDGTGISLDSDAASNFSVVGADLTLATTIAGDINISSVADVDIGGATAAIDTTGTLSLDAGGAGNFNAVGLTLEAGTGAFTIEGDTASTINVDTGNLTLSTTTSGIIAINSGGILTLNDSTQTSAINFSQSTADGFATEFTYTSQTDFDWTVRDLGITAVSSVMGALNTNREDLYEYVELIRTQGAAYTAAAGASLVGTDGISGVTPTGGSYGGDANLQAMLEGISDAAVAGSLKSYTNIAAFTAAKAGSTYFEVGDVAFIQDTNRFVELITTNTSIVEATDWDYLWDATNVMGGATFYATVTGAIALDSGAAVTINSNAGFTISDDSGAGVIATSAGRVDIDAAAGQIIDIASNTEIILNGGSSVDIDGTAVTIDGALTATGALNDDMAITTSGTGSVLLTGGAEVDLTATLIDINGNLDVDGTTADILVSGAFSIDGGSASNITVTAGALTIGTATSGNTTIDSAGEIYLNDTRTAAIVFSDASHTTLPGTATSILEALQDAYDNTGDTSRKSYEEKLVDGVSAAAEYIISTLADLPDTGTFPMVPSALRALTGNRFLAVYLNGLRLSDNEWRYSYVTGERRVTFDGANDIDIIDGDQIVLDLTYNDSQIA